MVNDAGAHAFLIDGGAPDAAPLPDNLLRQLLSFGAAIDDLRPAEGTPNARRETAAGMISDMLNRWNVAHRRAALIGGPDIVQAGDAAGVESHLLAAGSLPELVEPLINRLHEAS
jgi:hypothetical protein